jgi:hypothetical protein
MMWRVMLCHPQRANCKIVEIADAFMGATVIDQPREYSDGSIEQDEYQVDEIGKTTGVDLYHASATYVRTNIIRS